MPNRSEFCPRPGGSGEWLAKYLDSPSTTAVSIGRAVASAVQSLGTMSARYTLVILAAVAHAMSRRLACVTVVAVDSLLRDRLTGARRDARRWIHSVWAPAGLPYDCTILAPAFSSMTRCHPQVDQPVSPEACTILSRASAPPRI